MNAYPAHVTGRSNSTSTGIPVWPWALTGIGILPLFFMGLLVWYAIHGGILFGDVDWYRAGLNGLLREEPLYDQAKLLPHPLERPVFFDQAPSTALLSLVLLLPGDGWTWGFLMLSGTLVGLALVWPRVGIGGALLLAPVLILWFPITSALFWGNVNGLVFGLLAVAWRFPRAAAIAIGLAAAIKLIPILAVAWLAGKRQWRNVAIAVAIPTVATAVVLVWKGPETLTDFITLRLNQWSPDKPYRWGLADAGLPPMVGYGFALALAVFAWRRASFSISLLAMLAAIPAMHAHYWTWLLIPFLGTWMPWLIQRQRQRAVRTVGRTGPVSASRSRE